MLGIILGFGAIAGTDLDNLLVHHTGQENMLLIFVGMEAHYVCHLAVREILYALASFCIP
jgi:hypothetical protein